MLTASTVVAKTKFDSASAAGGRSSVNTATVDPRDLAASINFTACLVARRGSKRTTTSAGARSSSWSATVSSHSQQVDAGRSWLSLDREVAPPRRPSGARHVHPPGSRPAEALHQFLEFRAVGQLQGPAEVADLDIDDLLEHGRCALRRAGLRLQALAGGGQLGSQRAPELGLHLGKILIAEFRCQP